MSALNPYESFLDGRPAEEIIAATPAEVGKLIEAIGPARGFEAPAPGKWSPGEIVAHLADCELVFGFRLRQTLADLGTLYLLLLGGVAIVVMLWAPKGIWGLIVERFGWQVFPLERRVILDDRGAHATPVQK